MSSLFLIFNILLLAALLFGSVQYLKAETRPNSLEQPPIIIIPDDKRFRFPSGSAQLSLGLRQYIDDKLVPTIEENRNQFNVDVVEIIGHTDGQVNRASISNLDANLENAVRSNRLNELRPGSNAELGLLRALAVANRLRTIQRSGSMRGLQFRAYSAAQLYLLNGELASPDRRSAQERRRIEVRFTRLGDVKME